MKITEVHVSNRITRIALAVGVMTLLALAAFALIGADRTSAFNSATSVTASADATCVLTNNQGVQCWGSLSNSGYGSFPVDVSGVTSGIAAVSAGGDHVCALTTGGGVKCWGGNYAGQVGNGTTTEAFSPANVTGLTSGVAAISAGKEHTCALTTGGGVKCWGDNQFGGLGDGTTSDSYVPVDVSGLGSGVVAIESGHHHTCALTTGGGLKCWGYNLFGQLGDGTSTSSSTPVDVTGLSSGVASVSAGDLVTCAVTTGGAAKCWGDNEIGTLGIGTSSGPESCAGYACARTPQDVDGLSSGVSKLTVGSFDVCALMTTGSVSCWGWNEAGQLGVGTESGPEPCGARDCSTTPTPVLGLFAATDITSGWYHNCAVVSGGGVNCWGWNLGGQLGIGTDEGPATCSFGAYVDKACSPILLTTLLLGPVKPPATPTPMPVSCPVSPDLDFPEPGCEVVEVSGTLVADITSPFVDTFTCPVRGPVQVARYQNPGAPHDGDNDTRRDTDIEMLYSNLQGNCTGAVTPGVFPIIIRQDPAQRSLGTMEEQTPNDPDFFPADSIMNSYAIIHDITLGRDLHLENAVVMECIGFTAVPITGCTFSYTGGTSGQESGIAGAPPDVELFDEDDVQIGVLTDVELTPEEVDSDLDGCGDDNEMQDTVGSQTSGGLRDHENFWDYADMPNLSGQRDREVRLSDILAVIGRYATNDAGATTPVNRFTDPLVQPPAEGYHPAFDRSAGGPASWNVGPADGQVAIADILAVIYQYFHDC
jgi:alpha-tubulin suppressor-like RCC1 family protein